MSTEKQLGRAIFHTVLSIMKSTLSLEELSYREAGREDPRYRTFKKHLMEFTYQGLRELLEDLEDWSLLTLTEQEEDCSSGWRSSNSGGSGYLNSTNLDKLLEKIQPPPQEKE